MNEREPLRAEQFSDEELLDHVLLRAMADRFRLSAVTRWIELAREINAGNRDLFPDEIARALDV